MFICLLCFVSLVGVHKTDFALTITITIINCVAQPVIAVV